MQIAERIACLFWIVLSIAVGAESYRLGLGTPQEPETGFLPFWTAALLCTMAIAHLIQLRVSASRHHRVEWSWGEHWKRVVILILALTIYAIILPTLGYLIATFLLMAALFSLYGKGKWWMVAGASLLVIGMTHVIFNFWLKIQLPRGIWGIG